MVGEAWNPRKMKWGFEIWEVVGGLERGSGDG